MRFSLAQPTRRLSSPFFALTLSLSLCYLAQSPVLAQDKPADKKPATAQSPQAAQKVLLIYKAQKGQVRKSKGTASLTLEAGAQKATLDILETAKQTYTNVAANGDITYEETTESSEVRFNGDKQPDDDKQDTNTVTIRPNGLLIGYTSTKEDKDDVKFAARLYHATNPVFSEKPVGVGDKWTLDFKADDTLGIRAAKAEYEVVNQEKVGEIDAVKIKFTYAETASGGVTSKGTYTIEKASGDAVAADIEVAGIPLGPPGEETPANGRLLAQRIEGGPLPGSKNVAEAKKKEKTIDDVIKEFEKLPGLLTLYRKREPGTTKDTLYLELPEDKLNKLMYLQVTASTGTAEELIAGDNIADILFQFTKNDDEKVLFTVPNWYYRADPTTPMGRAVRRSFADAYLQSFKIEAKQPDRKSVLIDVSDLFRSDFAQITQALNGGGIPQPGRGPGGFSLDREKTFIDKVKNFPENLTVYTQYHFTRAGRGASGGALADPRSLPLTVAYNLIALPNDPVTYKPTNGFVPRKADPRVGYFTTEYILFDDDGKEDQTERLIVRWQLEKKDPSAPLSEPVKPIKFWLDNAIPVEYREAVKKGILAWNKAFEKAGFKDAIVVEQQPDKADWDHADLRYNVVRWVVTPDDSPRNGVAIALFRVNPLTGQVLNASISVDSSWTRYGKLQRRNLIDPAAKFREGANMEVENLMSGLIPLTDEKRQEIERKVQRFNHAHSCRIGEGLKEKAWFGHTALELSAGDTLTPEREKAYADELLTETVAHEMGHILGLRHNFIASTELSLGELRDAGKVANQGISASLMDYNAFNISAIAVPGVHFYSQTVGTYDIWAIEYGYTPFAATEEMSQLRQVASRSTQPGHAYQSDEQVFVGIDPRVVQYDMSSDPLAYWEEMLRLSRRLMLNLEEREPKNGESYWEFTRKFNGLLGTYARAAATASRYVGGIKLSRNHKGDPQEQPPTLPVSATEQKKALGLLNTYVFSPSAFAFPERYFTRLTTDPFGFSFSQDAPIGDQITGIQRAALERLFAPSVLRRIANSEFKKNGNAQETLTLPVLFRSVNDNVWAEVAAPAVPVKPPMVQTASLVKIRSRQAVNTDAKKTVVNRSIPNLRRQLQRAHLDMLVNMVIKPNSTPEDAKLLAWDGLRQLKTRITVAKNAGSYDEYTRLHYTDSLDKINRVLDAKLTLGSAPDANPLGLLQMLLGGSEK